MMSKAIGHLLSHTSEEGLAPCVQWNLLLYILILRNVAPVNLIRRDTTEEKM